MLSLNEQFSSAGLRPLTADDEDLTATSRLSTEEALEALAAFEEVVRQGQDAIMQTADGAAADFIGHVWFVANALSELERRDRRPRAAEHRVDARLAAARRRSPGTLASGRRAGRTPLR